MRTFRVFSLTLQKQIENPQKSAGPLFGLVDGMNKGIQTWTSPDCSRSHFLTSPCTVKVFVQQLWQTRDWPSIGLLVALLVTVAWIALLPVSRHVQTCYLKRFQLQTSHFSGWAIQQLAPAMYNLENTYWFARQPLTSEQRKQLANDYFVNLKGRGKQAPANQVQMDQLNHFPTRTMTFLQSRTFLKQNSGGYFYFQSKYRGQTLNSEFQVLPVNNHEAQIVRGPMALEQ